MKIEEIANKISVPVETVAQTLKSLGLEPGIVNAGMLDDIKAAIQPGAITKDAPLAARPMAKQTPKTPDRASEHVAPRTANEVKTRRETAMVDALAAPSDTVSEILEGAKLRAAEKLAVKKESLVEQVADRIVDATTAEVNGSIDFLEKFMANTTQQALRPFQEVIEAEVISN